MVHEKPIYKGELPKRGLAQFGDLGGAWQKRGVDTLNVHYVTAYNYPCDFWKKSTWKTRHVSENKIKRIPSTF